MNNIFVTSEAVAQTSSRKEECLTQHPKISANFI